VTSVIWDTSVRVTYFSGANCIKLKPKKNRTEVNEVLQQSYNLAIALGFKINIITTDNEISKAAESYFAKLKVTRRVEPYNHRGNDCERHIQTAKAHGSYPR